jgi:hypothetical protein
MTAVSERVATISVGLRGRILRVSTFDGVELNRVGTGFKTSASASNLLHSLRITATQYAVYPFRPRSERGRSGVPGESVFDRVEG